MFIVGDKGRKLENVIPKKFEIGPHDLAATQPILSVLPCTTMVTSD